MEKHSSQQEQSSQEYSEPLSFVSSIEPVTLPYVAQTQHRGVSLSSLAYTEHLPCTPILDVIDKDGNLHLFANLYCWAVMVYPDDQKARDEYLITLKTQTGGRVREAAQSTKEKNSIAALIGRWLDPHGGFDALSKARGSETVERDFEKAAWPGAIAGDLLKWIVRLAYWAPPASVSKAFYLEELYLQNARDKEGRQGAHRKRSIIGAWKRYRAAAPLWAALRVWQFYYGDTTGHGPDKAGPDWWSLEQLEGLPGFLAHAEIFRRICVSLYAHGQSEAILDPAETWGLPKNLRLPNLSLAIPSLEDWALQALENYSPEWGRTSYSR